MPLFQTVQAAIDGAARGKKEIWLEHLGLTANDVLPLLEALKDDGTVTTLGLFDNLLGDDGAALVADMMLHNDSIESLSVDTNGVSDAGATAISEMLKTNINIRTLHLDHNNISAPLKQQLLAQVEANKNMAPEHRASRKTEVGAALFGADLGRYALSFYKDGVEALVDCVALTEEEVADVGVEAEDVSAVLAVLVQAHLKTEVGVALSKLGLLEYADMMWDRGFRTLDECSKLNGAQLRELGVKSLSHRRQLLKLFEQKRQSLSKRLSQALLGRRGSAEPDAPGAAGFQYDVFLTHDWGVDELGRSNHERATRMNAELKKLGLVTWFDEERLDGRVDQIMADGVQRSRVIAVFITQRYMHKVASRGHDNCEKEFGAATRMRTAGNMVPIVMEPRMRDTNAWTGPLQLNLGGSLFVDFSDDDKLAATAQEIHDRVRGLIAKQLA